MSGFREAIPYQLFIDTHAHLYYSDLYTQLHNVLERASSAGVEKIICVGTDLSSSQVSISIGENYDNIFATAGIHPHHAKDAPADYLDQLSELASHSKVVALGEMGLDFYRNFSPTDVQMRVFNDQLQLAQELGLPVIVHNRKADDSVCQMLETVGYKRGVIHCFSGDVKLARRVLEFGFLISFTGIVTFPSSSFSGRTEGPRNVLEPVLEEIGLGSIMLETDSPFLSPVPVRGRPNEPANIAHIASKIAEIKGETVETVARVTTRTALHFFGLTL